MHAPAINRRAFLRTATASGLLAALSAGSAGCAEKNPARQSLAKILIVGGGAAGLAMAARLRRLLPRAAITLVSPAAPHVCQPALPLVGSGIFRLARIQRELSALLPSGISWIPDTVVAVDAAHNTATLAREGSVRYDFLVLAPGVQQNWQAVQGVSRDAPGRGNAHTVHTPDGATRTWRAMRRLAATGGRAIFSDAGATCSGPGAALSLCLLTDDLSRKLGERDRVQMDFLSPARKLCDVPHVAPRLERIFDERGILTWQNVRLTGVDAETKTAHFMNLRTREEFSEEYEFLHFVPPQSAPDFVRDSGLGCTEGEFAEGGWVEVDPKTLVHRTYANIVALGDAAALPTAKTAAAVARQVPVAALNLCDLILGKAPANVYDGHAAVQVATDFGHVLKAEFAYGRRPDPTFPYTVLDAAQEQQSAWWSYRYLTLTGYFKLLLRGYV